MDTHNSKGKVAPRWSNLQAIGESWMQGAGTPLLVIHRAKTMVRIQSAQGWSMGSKGERSLPLVMRCRGAGTLPDW